MSYFSLSGLWNVICMISIWTIHIYLYSVNFKIFYQDQQKKNNSFYDYFSSKSLLNIQTAWKSLIPLIGYPFAALCFTSFYLSWLGIPFISSMNQITTTTSANNENKNNTKVTMIQYSIFLLSYIYGYLPHELYSKFNNISFRSMQPSRSLFFKQSFTRIIISNLVQTSTFCTCCVLFWRIIQFLDVSLVSTTSILINLDLNQSLNIFWILFRITFCLNYLWLIGELILNRLLTEKVDMGRYNGCQFPMIQSSTNNNTLSRNIDCRLLAITQSHHISLNYNINKDKHILYFYNLVLIELIDIVQFDAKKRKQIYSTQIYYNLIVETLLSEYTTFIIALYEYIYGDNYKLNKNRWNLKNTQHNNNSFWYKIFTLKPDITFMFRNYQILIHSGDILSFL